MSKPNDFQRLLSLTVAYLFIIQSVFNQTQNSTALSIGHQNLKLSQMALDSTKYQQAADLALGAHAIFDGTNDIADRMEAAYLAGQSLARLKKPDLALHYLEEAMLGFESKGKIAGIWFSIGICRNQLGEYDQAVQAYSKALELQLSVFGDGDLLVAQTYLALGEACDNNGDAGLALEYLKKNLSILQRVYGEEHVETAKAYHNLGLAHYSRRSPQDAERYIQRGLDILNRLFGDEDHIEIAYSYNGLGRVALSREDFDNAISYFNKSLAIRIKLFPPDHAELVAPYNNLGICWKNKSVYDKALNCFTKALEIRQKILRPGHPDLATPHFNMASCYQKKGDFERAIAHYDTALTLLAGALNPEHPYIAETHFFIAEVYEAWALQTGQIAHLLEARVAYRRAYDILLAEQKSTRNTLSKQQYLEQLAVVCEGNLRAGRKYFEQTGDLSGIADLWQYSESTKAYLLYEALQEANALHFAGIPDSLLARETTLRLELTAYHKRRQVKLDAGLAESHQSILALDSKIFDLNAAYYEFKTLLERDYPAYYRLKYDLSFSTLAETREELQPDQTLLEYVVGNRSIFLFVVKSDSVEIMEIKKDFPLSQLVNQFRQGIYAYHTSDRQTDALYEKGINEYLEAGQLLYQKLLAPVQDKLTSSLIIIPDGELGYLPFEALLTGVPRDLSNFGTYPFLLHRHTISYCYSATLLREMRYKKHRATPQKELLAFAPYYSGNSTLLAQDYNASLAIRRNLKPLKYSGEEVYMAQKMLGGDLFIGSDATKERFVQLANNYRILHLATHGRADDKVGDYSFLAFSGIKDSLENELLYVRDLLNISLNADLVVLSACETGIGQLQRGEGIISLARAFAFAGSKSIVTTLWSINDATNNDLMAYFYNNLKNGLPKDQSLTKAKKSFLEKHPGQFSHPFFWAALIAVGDMTNIRD